MEPPDRTASLTPSRSRGNRVQIAGLVVAVAALALLSLAPPSKPTLLIRALFDAGHAPLFGVVSLGLLAWLSRDGLTGGPERRRVYLRAFLIAAALGLLTEIVQAFTARDADPFDFLKDVLGAGGVLLFAATFERGVVSWKSRPHVPIEAIVRVVAVAVFLLAFVPVTALAIGYAFRNAAFPHVMDFESYWEGMFVDTRNARISLGYLPEPWTDPTRLVGVLTMPADRWPTFVLEEPYPDWTGYSALTFRVWSTEDAPLRLNLRVDDAEASRSRARKDRYQEPFTIEPGANDVVVPLEEIRRGPFERELDMDEIRRILIYADKPDHPITLYIDDFRLE